jgi:hypothetical protein
MAQPRLSVVCFASPHRERTQRCLEALGAQTAIEEIELILLDGGDPADRPDPPPGLATVVEELPPEPTLGASRALGIRTASDSVAIAFMSDHCYPRPGWARALIDAYREPWGAVGFVFTCPAPRTYGGRAAKIADHGPWLNATRAGRVDSISYCEASFRRDLLDRLGDDLEWMLETDFSLQQRITEEGLAMALEPEAVIVHENVSTVLGNARLSYQWSRLVGARHLGPDAGFARRVLYALVAPVAVPVMRTLRLIRDTRETVPRHELATALPAIIVKNLFEGVGQADGYLRGAGDASARVMAAELLWPRAGCG